MEGGARVIVSLDFQNAPIQTGHFIRTVEESGGGEGGRAGGSGGPAGRVDAVSSRVIRAALGPEAEPEAAMPDLSLDPNPAITHDQAGVFGLAGPNSFYLTLAPAPEMDSQGTALGTVVAGEHTLGDISSGDQILSIRILRSGQAALEFSNEGQPREAPSIQR